MRGSNREQKIKREEKKKKLFPSEIENLRCSEKRGDLTFVLFLFVHGIVNKINFFSLARGSKGIRCDASSLLRSRFGIAVNSPRTRRPYQIVLPGFPPSESFREGETIPSIIEEFEVFFRRVRSRGARERQKAKRLLINIAE